MNGLVHRFGERRRGFLSGALEALSCGSTDVLKTSTDNPPIDSSVRPPSRVSSPVTIVENAGTSALRGRAERRRRGCFGD